MGAPKRVFKASGNDTLRCWMCKSHKIWTLFGSNSSRASGRDARCKVCKYAYLKQYRLAHPEVERERDRKRKRTPSARARDRRRRSGPGAHADVVARYDALATVPTSRCAICDSGPTTQRYGRLSIDHDHATGDIRGLLCARCNTALGFFRDSATLLDKAAAYLRQHATQSGLSA